MSRDADVPLKILIIGPSNVGKSALLKRYCDGDFDPNDAAATIGIDYRIKRLSVHGKTYRISLLDTAGQERFRTLSTSYYRGVHGILFVYDLTNRATFAQMDAWFAEADANTGSFAASPPGPSGDISPHRLRSCQYALVAAKLDRADTGRAVSTLEGIAMARKHGCGVSIGNISSGRGDEGGENDDLLFFETSARTGDNVRDPFLALVDRIVMSGVTAPGVRAGAKPLVLADGSGGSSYIPGCLC